MLLYWIWRMVWVLLFIMGYWMVKVEIFLKVIIWNKIEIIFFLWRNRYMWNGKSIDFYCRGNCYWRSFFVVKRMERFFLLYGLFGLFKRDKVFMWEWGDIEKFFKIWK